MDRVKKYDVVVSGIAGLYPECDDVEELWGRLMRKEDMVTIDGRRWLPGEFDVPPGCGKIKHTEYFDMAFFGIHKKLCDKTDPTTRLLCEQGYRAICDAGVNPSELDGSNMAVIINSYNAETMLDLGATVHHQGSYNVLAFSGSMQANRLSYFLNTKGPSFQMDNTGCGGIEAIQYACDLISNGVCTAAIVGSCSLIYKAEASFHYQMMGRLSEDSLTRSFSADASGYARSESCVTLFLQRKEHAKRIYGSILGTHISCHGTKNVQYPGFPRGQYEEFLVEAYKKAKVNPSDLVYVEANGAASKTLDALELNGLSKALLKQRSKPLLIGSIKSNLGHAEGVSALVSLTKVLMAMDRGIIPPNINFTEPNPDVPDLVSGKLKVVTEPTPMNGGTVAVCALGTTGNCAHIILKSHDKEKTPDLKQEAKLPYLITMSARDQGALDKNLKDLENKEVDAEFAVLVNSLYKDGFKKHLYRGYTVISDEVNFHNSIEPAPSGERRPIWFMYSGMGSQWPTMAKSLMALPIFANAINKCHKILETKGVNLLEIVTKDDPKLFDNILHSFVGIAAVQIGLTDVLRAMGIEPDGIIGHSVGELGCAYADGCMTAEQMVLAAHARGRASIEATLIKGMMAAVGAGYGHMKNSIPETIEIACRNSKDSCTLSGPAEDMTTFIAQLKSEGMFAKLVNVANIAYHSRYIKPAAPALLKYLKEIIPTPVKRSSKWVSSSNMECHWDTHLAQHSSAEYHTNNLLSPVYFEDASSHIPDNAIVIEIAPHGLMQAIVKRSLRQAINIPLTSRFDQNNLLYFFGALGQMFVAGIPVDLHVLYPAVEYPVSRGTSAISPYIDWLREVSFGICRERDDPYAHSVHCKYIKVDKNHDGFDEMITYKIYGKPIIPASFYFKQMIIHFTSKRKNEGSPITIDNVKVLRYAEIDPDSSSEMKFQLLQGRGNVVVSNDVTADIILEGRIKITDAFKKGFLASVPQNDQCISLDNITSFMRCLGVEWDPSLISLGNVLIGERYITGTVRWEGDIGKFLMSLLALVEYAESKRTNALKLFHFAGEICVNLPFFIANNSSQDFLVQYDPTTNKLRSEVVEISLIECRNPQLGGQPAGDKSFSFELPQFMPYVQSNSISYKDCVNISTQLILENLCSSDDTVINAFEIGNNADLHDALVEISQSWSRAQVSFSSFPTEAALIEPMTRHSFLNNLWIICADHPSPATMQYIENMKNGFVLIPRNKPVDNLKIIFECQVNTRWYNLCVITKPIKRQYEVVNLNSDYLLNLRNQLLTAGYLVNEAVKTVILWGQVDSLIDVDTLLEETKDLPNKLHLHYWLFIGKSPEYHFNDSGFQSQIDRDVRMNIMKDGEWGSLTLTSANTVKVPSNYPSKYFFPLSSVAASQNLLALGLNIDDNSADANVPELGSYDYVSSNGIMGVGAYDPNSKSFIPDNVLCWQKPNMWTPKEAASVPMLYSLASFILHHTNSADDERNNTILINQALLPLSQALICLALYENLEVHATVYGTEEKQTLLKMFPKLNPKNIYDCSSVAFFVDVLKNTEGVYKVINNFDDANMISPCVQCTLPFGVLIYVNQELINKGAVMGMLKFNQETVAIGVSSNFMLNSSDKTKMEIKNTIAKALQGGGITPIRAVSLPSSTINTAAIEFLKSERNKVVVEICDSEDSMIYQSGFGTQVIVEGKSQANLSLNTVEWLLKRGSQKIVLFLRNSHLSDVNSIRLQLLREQYKGSDIEIRSSHLLSTRPQIENFIDEASPAVAMLFFLGSGLKERIVLFDEVLSRKLPDCIMVCIGKGGESVCERRKTQSLPVLYVRCSSANLESVKLDHYFDSLIKDSPKSPVVLVKKSAFQSKSLHGIMTDLAYVPSSKDELLQFMAQSKVTKATFVEVPSSGPPLQHNREVYPMFLIPGLRPNRLHKMASHLFCPPMEARIPSHASSIDQIAEDLANQLLKLPHNMFTLCAEGWGGILALHIAAKLEAESKYVNLILLDASPASIIRWTNSLLKNEITMIRKYLQVPLGIVSSLTNPCWDNEIQFAVSNSGLTDEDQLTLTTDCLNTLRRRLQSVLDSKPRSKKLNIKCHVFGPQSQAHEDTGLGDYLLNEPTLHTEFSKTADDMICEDVATVVNSLLLYEYKDAANPPNVDYIDRHTVKKFEPHWQGSLLRRVPSS